MIKIIVALALLAGGTAIRAGEFIAEASGVCLVGGSLVIAGDEEPDSFWVIDERTKDAKLVSVESGEWDDLEDLSAVDGRRFFAMTSHSRTKKGKRKPEREQLLLIAKDGARFEVTQSWSLRDSILSALEESAGQLVDLEIAEAATPEEGGLNVEGVAYHDGQLFLGLRSPLTENGEALVLRIRNARELLHGEAPVFDGVYPLPLGEKGIRGLTSYKAGLLLLAGSPNDSGQAFSLHHWVTGAKTVSPFPLSGFSALIRPEAVHAEKDGSFVFVQDFEEPGQQEVVVKLPGE